jgi:hypothetical protein
MTSNFCAPIRAEALRVFTYRAPEMVLACDRYRRVADNIAALATHIDALCRVERYGSERLSRRSPGTKALPADTAANWRGVFAFTQTETVTPEALQRSDEIMMQLNRAREHTVAEVGNL